MLNTHVVDLLIINVTKRTNERTYEGKKERTNDDRVNVIKNRSYLFNKKENKDKKKSIS